VKVNGLLLYYLPLGIRRLLPAGSPSVLTLRTETSAAAIDDASQCI